jgi:hypothetical protein
MLHFQESPYKVTLGFRHKHSGTSLPLVEIQEFMFYRRSQFTQILSTNGVSDRDYNLKPGFNEDTLIHRKVDLLPFTGAVCHDPGSDRRSAVQSMRQ